MIQLSPNIRVYLGDSTGFLRSEMYDVVVTDPPHTSLDKGTPSWFNLARMKTPHIFFTTTPYEQHKYPQPTWVGAWYRGRITRSLWGQSTRWMPIMMYTNQDNRLPSLDTFRIAESAYTSHPSAKPWRLYQIIMESAVKRNETVFDPFMGSGATAIAADHLGLNYIGCEINIFQFNLTRLRLENYLRENYGK